MKCITNQLIDELMRRVSRDTALSVITEVTKTIENLAPLYRTINGEKALLDIVKVLKGV